MLTLVGRRLYCWRGQSTRLAPGYSLFPFVTRIDMILLSSRLLNSRVLVHLDVDASTNHHFVA